MRKLLITSSGVMISNQEHCDASVIIIVCSSGNFYYDKICSRNTNLQKYVTYPADCLDLHISTAIKAITITSPTS